MDEIIQNLTRNLVPWWNTLRVLFTLTGLIMAAYSLIQAGFAARHHQPVGAKFWMFAMGCVLMAFGGALDAVSSSMALGPAPDGPTLSYSSTGAGSSGALYIAFGVLVIQLVGLYAFGRGWVHLASVPRDPDKLWSGLSSIFAGAAAVNFPRLMLMIGESAGGALQALISKIF